jgi:magnesium transporter
LEAVIDRIADVVERVSAEIDKTNRKIFSRKHMGSRKRRQLTGLIEHIGLQDDLVSKARESLASLERLLQFAKSVRQELLGRGTAGDRIDLMRLDVRSLSDQLNFLSGKTIFQLDATLGLISTEQNEVIRVLTVVATFFFPPTLIGTIYGMNFHFMPELGWWFGYPAALALMALSAIGPLVYFRHRGWM